MTRLLGPGATAVLLGSSGVGKSTLVNTLAGEELLATQEIRGDGTGRHTTTRRELIQLPAAALIIDTPGIREVQLWVADEGIDEAFEDITELFAHCRFSDCAHDSEPGCAVRAALARRHARRRPLGELPQAPGASSPTSSASSTSGPRRRSGRSGRRSASRGQGNMRLKGRR